MTGKTFVEKHYKDFGRYFGGVVEDIAQGFLTETDVEKGWTRYSSNRGVVCKMNGRTGLVQIVGIGRRNLGKIGTAKCSPADKFNLKTGIAIAWARYNGVNDIPDIGEPKKAPHPTPLTTEVWNVDCGKYFRYLGKKYKYLEPSEYQGGNFVQRVKKSGTLGKIILLPDTTEVELL